MAKAALIVWIRRDRSGAELASRCHADCRSYQITAVEYGPLSRPRASTAIGRRVYGAWAFIRACRVGRMLPEQLDGMNEGLDYRRRYRGLIGVHPRCRSGTARSSPWSTPPAWPKPASPSARMPLASFDLTCRGNTVAILTDGSDIFGREIGPAGSRPADRRGQERHLQDLRRGRRLPDLRSTPTDPERHRRRRSRHRPDLRRDLHRRHLRAARLHHRRPPGEGGRYPGLLQPAPRHGHPRPRRPPQRAQGRRASRSSDVTVVISGAGVAGIGVARLLTRAGVKQTRRLRPRRRDLHLPLRAHELGQGLPRQGDESRTGASGGLDEMLRGADVFIGLSTGNIVTRGDGPLDGAGPDRLRPGRAGAGNRTGAGPRGRRQSRRHRPLRLPEHDGHLARLPGCLPRPARFPGPQYPPAHPALRRAGAGRHGARLRAARRPDRAPTSSTSASPRRSPRQSSAPRVEAGEAGRIVAPEVGRARGPGATSTRAASSRSPTGPRGEQKTFREEAIELRRRHGGVLEIRSKMPIRDQHILNMVYVPPAALVPAYVIRDDPSQVMELTSKGNLVAIVTDGSAVLGLGDIGPQAALPVMEGKAVLFRSMAGVEAFPICLAARDPDEIVEIVAAISPSFGGINLEDISRSALLRDRAEAARAARHAGLPRRPARHRHHRLRRAAQCLQAARLAALDRSASRSTAAARPASPSPSCCSRSARATS